MSEYYGGFGWRQLLIFLLVIATIFVFVGSGFGKGGYCWSADSLNLPWKEVFKWADTTAVSAGDNFWSSSWSLPPSSSLSDQDLEKADIANSLMSQSFSWKEVFKWAEDTAAVSAGDNFWSTSWWLPSSSSLSADALVAENTDHPNAFQRNNPALSRQHESTKSASSKALFVYSEFLSLFVCPWADWI